MLRLKLRLQLHGLGCPDKVGKIDILDLDPESKHTSALQPRRTIKPFLKQLSTPCAKIGGFRFVDSGFDCTGNLPQPLLEQIDLGFASVTCNRLICI